MNFCVEMVLKTIRYQTTHHLIGLIGMFVVTLVCHVFVTVFTIINALRFTSCFCLSSQKLYSNRVVLSVLVLIEVLIFSSEHLVVTVCVYKPPCIYNVHVCIYTIIDLCCIQLCEGVCMCFYNS